MQGSALISLTCTFHYQLEFIVSTWVNQSTWHGEKKQTEKYRHCFFLKKRCRHCLYYCISQSFRYPWECWTVNYWTLCKPPVACSLYIYRRRALHYSSSKGGRNQDAGLVRAHCCACAFSLIESSRDRPESNPRWASISKSPVIFPLPWTLACSRFCGS